MASCSRGWGTRCPEATGPKCVCACGGANHGTYFHTPTVRTIPPGPERWNPPPPPTKDHDGEITPLEQREWLDIVLTDRAAFTKGLRELGLAGDTINEDVRRFDEASLEWKDSTTRGLARPNEANANFRAKLGAWLGLREHRVEAITTVPAKISLFKLHSPKVQGSKVSYIESKTETTLGHWAVTIFGTGMGKTRSFIVRFRNTFDSSNGDCKLIFVPVSMKVELIATYQKGKCIGRGLRTEMILKEQEELGKAIESMPEAEFLKDLDTAVGVETIFDFSGDSSSAIHKADCAAIWDDTLAGKFGLDAFKFSTENRTTITRTQEIGLTCELPAGHKYWLRRFQKERGITWEVN